MNNQDKAAIEKIDWDVSRELIAGKLKNEVLFDYIQQRHLRGLLTVTERNWAICLLYQLGQGRVTYKEIGECFGDIGRERIRQILEKTGLSGLEKPKMEDVVRDWLAKLIIDVDSQELIKAVMQKVASDKRFWTTDFKDKTSGVGKLRVRKVLEELGMPFADKVYAGYVWIALIDLGLVEEDGLLGVLLRYGFDWSQAQILDFFRANYFKKDEATLGDILLKINNLASKKGLMTITSSQTIANYFRSKRLKPKNSGCSNPVWLFRRQQI